ncbi:alpha/beta fold hydrolase [Thaumasiovibrio subtropicus]|uniref:alpha/beta fold hydrolase n=1 Tax=Thaumasiovibrio subtropicus TaxID=1891207 RepID=UPI000B34D1EB|nr:alpha/beta hydrolase [Thaumasiovibrio subtropicus]
MKKSLIALTLTALSMSASATMKSHLVLVHGAHFGGESWQQVEAQLPASLNTIAVNLPGRSEKEDATHIGLSNTAQALCNTLTPLSGKVHLAAHSQGGAIVNHALGICPEVNVSSITYISAVAPLIGEKAFQNLSQQDENHYLAAIRYNENTHRMEIFDTQRFSAEFAQDATPAQTQRLINTAINEPAHIAEEKVSFNQQHFNAIDKHYVFTLQDRIISLASQVRIASQIHPNQIHVIDSGHSPMATHSDELAEILTLIASK